MIFEFILFLSSLVYGLIRLLFPNLNYSDNREIKEIHRKTYSRWCGVTLLLIALSLGLILHSAWTAPNNSPSLSAFWLPGFVLCAAIVIHVFARKKFKA